MNQLALSFPDPDPMKGASLEERLLVQIVETSTRRKPVSLAYLVDRLESNDRHIKGLIRSLRRDRALPILASRRQPSGYYWAHSSEEMLEFINTFKAQALDELQTAARIVRAHFPELAGQLRLELD